MVHNIDLLKSFAKFTEKREFCGSLVFNEVASWKISENCWKNSQENNCAAVSFLIKLLAKKFQKIHKKKPVPKVAFSKVACLRPDSKMKSLIYLHFFTVSLIARSRLSSSLTQCVLLLNGMIIRLSKLYH